MADRKIDRISNTEVTKNEEVCLSNRVLTVQEN